MNNLCLKQDLFKHSELNKYAILLLILIKLLSKNRPLIRCKLMSMQLFIFSTLARLFPRTAHVQAECALWLRFIMVVTQKVDHLYPAPHSFKLMSVQLFIFSTLARLFPRTAHAQAVCALWLRFITVVTQIVSHLYLVTVEWTSLVAARLREFEWNVMGIHCLLPFLRKF